MTYLNSDFRVRKTTEGYIVEKLIHKRGLFRCKTEWVAFVVFGVLPDDAFYFHTFDGAMENLLREVITQTRENSEK